MPRDNLSKMFCFRLCKSQHMTLAMGFSFWGTWNPSAKYALTLANDLRWGKRGRVPTFALSVLKPLLLEPLPVAKGWLRCVSKGGGHPAF